MTVKTFYFNPFRECTYVLSDPQGHAVIIDAGMYDEREEKRFADYIAQEQLHPIALLITHSHPDHVCGAIWLEQTYGLQVETLDDKLANLSQKGWNIPIEVIPTPGHKEDSVCFYLPTEKKLFTGDTLFQESIGRTDLDGGDMSLLIESLHRLMFMDDDIEVYPGHGYPTTIGHERQYNPYIQ